MELKYYLSGKRAEGKFPVGRIQKDKHIVYLIIVS
jgi:hypothetical protein